MAAFQGIKAISSSLLQHRSDPSELSNQLLLLHTVMSEVRSDLTPLRDYLLFPLMLILDSVHPSRAAENQDPPPVTAARSNRVVEATLNCLSLLLQILSLPKSQDDAHSELSRIALESHQDRLEQNVELLQRLMPILYLFSPQAAKRDPQVALSDEAAALTLGCISTILISLPAQSYPGSEEGSFLPLIGFLISTMFQIGGATESPSLKLSSLKTLDAIIRVLRVHDAQDGRGGDALAFFLPGIVGGLAKILLGLESSSASLSSLSSCTAAALKCLTDVLSASLGDHRASVLLPPIEESTKSQLQEDSITLDEAVGKIKDLALKASASESTVPTSPAPPTIPPSSAVSPSSANRPSFLVTRTKDWLTDSGKKVSPLLLRLLPPLSTHPRASVRSGVASLATSLLNLSTALIALGTQGQGERIQILKLVVFLMYFSSIDQGSFLRPSCLLHKTIRSLSHNHAPSSLSNALPLPLI
jgi:hypothetical protein